jgi:hypothetical protein
MDIATQKLSAHDSKILRTIFDPESNSSSLAVVDHSRSSLPNFTEVERQSIHSVELRVIRQLDVAEPSPIVLDYSLAQLNKIILENPQYAPAYVNRAQILRLKSETSQFTFSEELRITNEILNDLSKAITLVSPPNSNEPVSPFQAKLLSVAYTHRGYLFMRASEHARISSSACSDRSTEYLTQLEDVDMEELANKDFYLGGLYGNRDAQRMAIKTNPYAKMCGAIVQQALQEHIDQSK